MPGTLSHILKIVFAVVYWPVCSREDVKDLSGSRLMFLLGCCWYLWNSGYKSAGARKMLKIL